MTSPTSARNAQRNPPLGGDCVIARLPTRNAQRNAQGRLRDCARDESQPVPTLDGTRAARAREWAADAIARARWLAHEAKRGDAWPTLEGAFARARLADVFALLADGHAQAAEDLRRTLRPPPGTTTTPGPHVDRSRPPRRVLGHADARHGAVAPSTP